MRISSRLLGIALPLMLVLGACAAPPSLSSVNFAVQVRPLPAEPLPVERIELPDGTVCQFVGTEATLTIDEKRVSYACAEPQTTQIGLLGDLQPGEDGGWSIEKVTFSHGDDGFVLVASETIPALAAGLVLEDGTECLHTGNGETLAFDEARLNYICRSEGDEIQGLLGDPTVVSGLGWQAELANIAPSGDEYMLEDSSIVAVRPVRIVVDDGRQCLSVGNGETPTFDGKPVNYLCENGSRDRLVLLGDIVDAGAGSWRVETARITASAAGASLVSSEPTEFRLASISLSDGTICTFAGDGETLAVDDQRAAFTCGASGENSVVVLGDLQPGAGSGVWLAEKATLARAGDTFTVASSEMLPVVAVHGDEAVEVAAFALQAALPVPVGVWQWEKTVTASNSLVAPRDPTLYTLQFVPDGSLYIRADCNSGHGSYEISGESLTMGPVALTSASCAPGSLSEPFVGQIANAISLQVVESELTLGLLDGSTMTFTAQE